MKKIVRIVASMIMVAVMLTGMAGCSSGAVNVRAADLMDGVKADSVTVDKKAFEFAGDVTDFAVRLVKECSENAGKAENMLISPLSVLLALSMTANGAQNETLAQMESVLGMSANELNEFAYRFMHDISAVSKNSGSLEPANAIWFKADPGFAVNKDFLQTNANYYDADLYSAPFDDSTLKDINKWVKNKTKGMIPSILDRIPDDTVMYLINALAFDAEWEEPYKKNQVYDEYFTTAGGDKKEVSFMHSEEARYIEDENATGFIKYYKNCQFAFAAILPNEDLSPADYLQSLSGEHLYDMIRNPEVCAVITSTPKFKTEYSVEMSEILKAMGMSQAFDDSEADFGKIGSYNGDNLYISRVLHKTFIDVDEKGTKAGAATAVEMNGKSAPMEPVEPKTVFLTRPFIYMLIDCGTGIPFFIGVMNDPEK